jgi:hypothetical protein
VIVVIGSPHARRSDDGRVHAAGLSAQISLAAAGADASVQVVGRVGEDATGEAVLLDLARQDVGHIAVLRGAGRPTREEGPEPMDDVAAPREPIADGAQVDGHSIDAADLQLALSYLPDYRVVVVAEALSPDAMTVAAGAVGWAGSALIVVGSSDDLADLPEGVTVFAPPDDDTDGAFAALVGRYAAGLDRGQDPRAAFDAAVAAVGSNAAE